MTDDQTNIGDPDAEEQKPSGRRIVALAASVALVVVVVLVALVGFAVGSTAVCSGCHAAQATALEKSPHKGTPCERCHFGVRGPFFARVDVVTRMVPASVFGIRLQGPGHPVGNVVCISCHVKMVRGGPVMKAGLRIDHTVCIVGATCESCHGPSVHGTTGRLVQRPRMADCVACHTERKAPLGCKVCHVGEIPRTSASDALFVKTHGPEWKKYHGTGDLGTCVLCHDKAACRPCHDIDFPHPANFGANHGKVAIQTGQDACLTCHKASGFCVGCHGAEMPHPIGFLQRHSKVASSVNDPKCAVCHVIDDCAQCHGYHIHPGGTRPPVGRYGNGR
jgi:hypothetical protein